MHRRPTRSLSQILIPAVLLFSIWILFSGKFELKLILIGLFSSIIISIICFPFMLITNNKSGKQFFVFDFNILKFLSYSLWLLIEIIKSSVEVAKEIFKPNMEYEPLIVYFSMPFENPLASVVLANSIILTPGTITIDVDIDGVFEVHALSKNFASGLLDGRIQNRIAKLFDEDCQFTPLEHLTVIRKGVR